MDRIILIVFALLVSLAFNSEGSAQAYKYVDKDGVIHFTDTPTDKKYLSQKESTPAYPAAPSVSLDCKNLDLRSVFQGISNAWGVNILMAGDVQGKLTLRRANTPADTLLDEILSMKGLVRFQEGDSIIIARVENAGQIHSEINRQKQILQLETEKVRLTSRIKTLSDQTLQDIKYPIYKKKALNEAMQIMNSTTMNGDSSDVEFLRVMKELVDTIESEKPAPHILELLADKARAIKGQPGAIRSKPINIPPPIIPPPIVNVFK